MSLRAGFEVLGHRFVATQTEGLPGVQLRHEVVVVGVEPLRHFQCAQVHAILLQAAREREVAGQRIGIGQCAVGVGQGVEQERGVQHMVVQREVVAGHDIGAGIALQLPVAMAQVARGVLQRLGAAFAAPVAFECGLQFALHADAREAEGGNGGHGACPHAGSDEERRNRAPGTRPPRQRPSPPRASRSAGRKAQEDASGQARADAGSGRLPSEAPGQAEDGRVFRPGQVFGLMDGRMCAGLLPTASRPARTSAVDGVRFQIPLRGSAGIGPWNRPHRLPF